MTPERPRHLAFLARLPRLAPLLLTAALLLGGQPQALAANLPTGGSVAAGGASIGAATGNALTVTQTSSSAVLNWQSFSVGQGYSVNFVQPSSSSTILNRVTGSTTSTIAGSINANGHVYLINPNGIVITATGTVNTGAFVASTLGISDADFMAGKRTFTGNGTSASVTNAGVISIGRGGYAALLGGAVDNAGAIVVPLGKVGLGSGERATLDFSGDGFLQVAIPTAATGTGALVANSGRIVADGGLVMLSAAAAKDMARQAINMSGTIEAKSVSGVSGDIVLAGSDGAVDVSGTLATTSTDSTGTDATGGDITVTGRAITLTGASLDASGLTGGGSVKLGGDWQGTGTLQHADTLTVDAASTITADATSSGNGGTVVLWSDDLTTFAGTISAKGGATSGDGGQAEVSGKALLAFTGFANLSAANGSSGTLLLDPYNVTISDAPSTSGFTASANDSIINTDYLMIILMATNITVSTGTNGSQTGDITVASALSWVSFLRLTLSAYHSIIINAGITITGNGKLVLVTNNGGTGGTLTFGSGGSVNFASGKTGQSLTINGTAYTLLYSMANIDDIDNDLTGYYALARSLDATGTPYADALVAGGDGSTSFVGTFEGLGHTITGLTIAKTDVMYAGLFGYVGSGGVVRDIGLIGGSVSGMYYVGGLVGYNSGALVNAYSTGSVSGTGDYVGGLVGINDHGTVSNSYATGTVSGVNDVGGLVGENYYGTITSAYATGTARGTGKKVGGLVGLNDGGTISYAYATGAVSGTANLGGLVGKNDHSGVISSSYWDTGTTGQSTSAGGGTGLTTAQLQNSSTAAALGNAFTLTSTLYPYLTSFFPNGVQAISGIAYKDTGATAAASGSNGVVIVTALAGGSLFGTAATGANGYYYIFATSGAFTTGNSLLAYTTADATTGAANAATLATATASAGQAGLNLYADRLGLVTSATTLSALPSLTTLQADALAAAGSESTALAVINATTGQVLICRDGFTIDEALNITTNMVVATAAGKTLTLADAITVETGGSLTFAASGALVVTSAGSLTVESGGSLALASGTALTVSSPVTVKSGGSLALTSGGTLTINGLVTVQGSGAVTLAYGASTSSNLSIGNGGSITYTDASGSAITSSAGGTLTINGASYTLLYSMADIDAIDATDATGLAGKYALAGSLDATDTTYTDALVGIDDSNAFTGTFEGLGHTITGLTIAKSGDYAGLLGYAGSGAILRDLGLINVSVSGTGYVGGLAGYSAGAISNAYTTGGVTGSSSKVGGLVGYSSGTLTNVHSASTVTSSGSNVGGLVGANYGTVTSSYATGNVIGEGNYVGGLAGSNDGTITTAYATGAVTSPVASKGSFVGGLVGYNSYLGTISYSYATGAVTGYNYVGGLVGYMGETTLSYVYATGAVSGVFRTGGLVGYNGLGTITNAYATGAVTGDSYVGGLVGINVGGALMNEKGKILNSYATGAVIAGGTRIGGFVGWNDYGMISNCYSTGAVTGYSDVGGFLGYNFSGHIYSSYWNKTTSGLTVGIGNNYYYGDSQDPDLTGLTTTQLQNGSSAAGLGSAFTLTSGLYPYLTSLFPSGVQAISGYAYKADGTTVLKSSSSGAGVVYVRLGDGSVLTASTGANGYYYIAVASGSISASGTGVLAYTVANASTGAANAATYTTKATGSLTSFNVYGGLLTQTADSGIATLSALDTAYTTASTGTTASGLSITNRTITALASGFAIDDTASVSGTLTVKVPGNLTIASTGSVSGADVSLQASGAFINQSGADAVSVIDSDLGRWLIYSANSDGDTFGGLDSGNTAVWNTAAGATVSASGNRYVFAVKPTVTVTTTDASKTYGDTADVSANYTVTGAVNGVAGAYLGLAASGILSGALASGGSAATANAGDYSYTQNSLAVTGGYVLSFVNAGTLTVAARAITVTANAQSRTYGDANPGLTYSITSGDLAGSDILTGILTTAASSSSNVGDYAITQGTLAASANYAVTYEGATLSITTRPITITANAASSVYGDTPSLTYSITSGNMVNGNTLSGSLASGTSSSAVGNYGITQGTLAASANYAVTYVGATLSITLRPITVTANAQSSVYGDTTPSLTYNITSGNLVNGNTLSGSLATSATSSSNVGNYGITQGTLAASTNYAVTYVGATLSITARPITVTANSQSSYRGFVIPALTYTVGGSGLANGEALSGSLATTATSSSPNGTYAITQGSVQVSANYAMTFVPGLLTVRTVTISDTSILPSAVERSWRLNTAGAGPAAPTDTLTVTYGGSGGGSERGDEVIFSSPRFDGLALCPGGDCARPHMKWL